jgi:hypothetical protein
MLEALKPIARKVLLPFRRSVNARIVPLKEMFPEVEIIPLLESAEVSTPELAGMNLVPGVAHYGSLRYQPPPMFAAILPDVLYCPVNNVVFASDGRIVAESISTMREVRNLDLNAMGVRRVTALEGYSASVRSVHNNYYHSLLDNPSRLFALGLPPLRRFEPIKVLVGGGMTPLERFLWPQICPSNVRLTAVSHRQLYRVENFVFVSYMTQPHAAYLHETYVRAFRRALAPGRHRTGGRRILVSRGKATNGRRFLNQADVERILAPKGFEKVILEEMTLNEQRELFYEAGVVFAAHGAGLANLVYADGARVIEWFPSRHFVPSYYFLSKSLGHTYEAYFGGAPSGNGDVMVNEDRLRRIAETL